MSVDHDSVGYGSVSQKDVLATLWAGVAISFCFLLFRFYVRLKLFRRIHIEDPFVLAAWLMNLVFAALWQKNANKLYSDLAVKSGKISIPPAEFVSYLEIGVRSELASSLLWVTALWSIKISFLLFFRDLGKHIRRQMMLWYCVLGYTVASYITCLGLADYGCVAAKQGLEKCRSRHAAHLSPTYLGVKTALDTTADALIIVVSTSLLWNASVELRKKLALTGIFCLTILIIGVSIIRFVLTTSGPHFDLTWLVLWSGLEITVAIIVACIASFRMLYVRSERSRHSALNQHHPYTAATSLSGGFSIPLEARTVQPTFITANEWTRHQRHTSTATFEEAILPMHGIHPHRHSVLSGPAETYEEIRAALESPVDRLHNHQLPSYAITRNTLSYEFGHPVY